MTVYGESSVRTALTPWGLEVKKRLLEKGLLQDDVVKVLQENGFSVNKIHFSKLLYGIGASARGGEIKFISDYLEIPFKADGAADSESEEA